jgi:hypothetical protein
LVRPEGALAIFLLFAGGGLAILTVAGAIPYDRYVWPLVGPLAALLLIGPALPPRAKQLALAGSAVTAAVLAVVSLALAANAGAFDIARWRAGDALVAAQVPAGNVDAGFEWLGSHIGEEHRGRRPPGAVAAYDRQFPSAKICAVVAASRLHDARLTRVGIRTYHVLGVLGPTRHLFLYRDTTIPACGP